MNPRTKTLYISSFVLILTQRKWTARVQEESELFQENTRGLSLLSLRSYKLLPPVSSAFVAKLVH